MALEQEDAFSSVLVVVVVWLELLDSTNPIHSFGICLSVDGNGQIKDGSFEAFSWSSQSCLELGTQAPGRYVRATIRTGGIIIV